MLVQFLQGLKILWVATNNINLLKSNDQCGTHITY